MLSSSCGSILDRKSWRSASENMSLSFRSWNPVGKQHVIISESTMAKDKRLNMFRIILQWTWELPQTLLGLIVFVLVRLLDRWAATHRYGKSTVLTRTTLLDGGVSLGMFPFFVRLCPRPQHSLPRRAAANGRP